MNLFSIVLSNGFTIKFETDTDDKDVAVFRAKRQGWKAVAATLITD
jgi:hypothetical protein